MIGANEKKVIDFLKKTREGSSKEVFDGVNLPVSYAPPKEIIGETGC